MTRRLYFPGKGVPTGTIVKVHNGGTGAGTAPAGLAALHGIPASQLGDANGLLVTGVGIKLDSNRIPGNNGPTIEGPVSLSPGQLQTYVITNFDDYTTYVITALAGTVNVINEVVYYTPPTTLGMSGFVVNGKTMHILVTHIVQPAIVSPVVGSVISVATVTFGASQFLVSGETDTHQGADWQISTNAGFTNVVQQVTNDATSLVSWTVAGLLNSTTYYVRVRYKGALHGYSAWSDIVAYVSTVTPAITVDANIVKPTITYPISFDSVVAIDPTQPNLNPTFTSSAFAVLSGTSIHAGSSWQLSTSGDFSNVVQQLMTSSINKTSWKPTVGLAVGVTYYIRVRHVDDNLGTTNWSDVAQFTPTLIV